MQILLVEDNQGLGRAIHERLAIDGHHIIQAGSCVTGEEALRAAAPDAVLLDLRLPDGSGLDLLRGMRRRGDRTAVIILTARDQVSDRIAGLMAGADDYLVKPFDLDELAARVQAVCRRCNGARTVSLSGGAVVLDRDARRATVDGQQVTLTAREWAVLDLVAQRPGTVVARERIEDALAATGADFESNAVEVYVSRIRRKLGAGVIGTLRGLGYRAQP